MYSLKRITEPTVEPITLDQVKSQCRIDGYDEDGLLEIYIKAAREHCEKVTGRAILQQTWRLTRNGFYRDPRQPARGAACVLSYWATPILLPRPNLIQIESLKYYDIAGEQQTVDPSLYVVAADSEPAQVSPLWGSWWPATAFRPDAVQLTYTAGYGSTAAAVPAVIQMACLLLVGHWYENREATQAALQGNGPMPLPLGVDELLSDETVFAFTYES